MKLRNIAEERADKIRSLLTDKIQAEKTKFWAALAEAAPELPETERNRIAAALDFNLSQDYGPGERNKFYGVHPMRVARFLIQSIDPASTHYVDAIVAALVHNAIEKKILDKARLSERFGPWITEAVITLTPDREKTATEDGLRDYYASILKLDREVRVLKALDKFDNIFSLCLNPDDGVRTRYLAEIRKYVVGIVKKDCPQLAEYFEALVSDAEKLGHYRPEEFS